MSVLPTGLPTILPSSVSGTEPSAVPVGGARIPPLARPGNTENSPLQNLQLGQIIYAKVLRVYADNSYLVDIHGREHVVDSAVPLTQNEVLRGRIVGVGERTVLEKILDAGSAAAPAPVADPLPNHLLQDLQNTQDFNFQAFVQQHRNLFSAHTWSRLLKLAKQNTKPASLLFAAVYLQKVGIPLENTDSTPLLRAFAAHLATRQAPSVWPTTTQTLYLNTESSALAASALSATEARQQLAKHLQEHTESQLDQVRALFRAAVAHPEVAAMPDVNDTTHDTIQDTTSNPQLFNQATLQWLSNAQSGGAVTHRVMVLPLVLNGQLVELEMALFDQQPGLPQAAHLRARIICLALTLDGLGPLTVTVHALNQHLKIVFAVQDQPALDYLSNFQESLQTQLRDLGYQLDELSYLAENAQMNPIMQPLVTQRVNADSLSVLI